MTRLAQRKRQPLEMLWSGGALGALTDPELLKRFETDRGACGQEAFRILVERHGPMVLGVCRSLVPDVHEAEDAFQATFLVLVRKGHAIWMRDSVGPWIYGVASRVARKARRRAIERQRRQSGLVDDHPDSRAIEPEYCVAQVETERVVHEEVTALSASLRDPVVLCVLQGLSYQAASRQLGVSESTLRGRLGRARRRLAARLRDRGFGSVQPATALLTPLEPFGMVAPRLPAALVHSTVQRSVWWSSVSGLVDGASAIPGSIATLARSVSRSLLLNQCKVLGMIALLAAGAIVTVLSAQRATALPAAPARRPVASPTARAATLGSNLQKGDKPLAPSATRVIDGRVTDAAGRPVREGKVMFGPKTVLAPFDEAGMAAIDAEGRFRIELAGFSFGAETLPATGPLRYLVLAPGFRDGVGNIEAGSGPTTLDLRLTAGTWTTTEIRLVDRGGKPVAGASVSLRMDGPFVWSLEISDADGHCRVKSAPGHGFAVSVKRDGYLPARFGSRGTADDPKSFTVPLYPQIEGRVVDETGTPLPGIQVGRLIAPNYDAGLDKPSDHLEVMAPVGSKAPAITDGDGRFTLAPVVNMDRRTGEFKIWPLAVCFADSALRRVSFLTVDVRSPRSPYTITLRPARQVRIPIEHVVTGAAGALEGWWELNQLAGAGGKDPSVFVMQGLFKKSAAGQGSQSGDWIEAYWPEGKYRIELHSFDPVAHEGAEATDSEVVVPPGQGPLVLPPIRMKVLPQRELVGQPAPEVDARDLNTGAPLKLADHRGKVIVLDFWGSWCGPCIGAMPALIEAHDRFKGKPVVFIALHDQSIQTRDAYDRKLTEIKRLAWNNRELPFQVALDRPEPEVAAGDSAIGHGISCKRYQIRWFPTTLVIDQEGKVAGTVEVREKGKLEAMVNKLLDQSPKK